jgi:hypothetical protein
MHFKKVVFVLVVTALMALPAISRPVPPDPVTGDWDVTCQIEGFTVPGTMSLKVEGDKVSGSVDTQHTGHGTIADGVWKDGKLSFTATFEKHEPIVFTGSAKDGKLTGEFKTEGNTGQWSAVPRKKS